jgi:hypothetical protein
VLWLVLTAVEHFRITVTIYMISLIAFYPLSFSPKKERFLAPSPLGEGWEGGNLVIRMT